MRFDCYSCRKAIDITGGGIGEYGACIDCATKAWIFLDPIYGSIERYHSFNGVSFNPSPFMDALKLWMNDHCPQCKEKH